MSDIINLGIIGHGFMGHEHEAMLSDFEGIRVTAVCDTAADQLEDVKVGILRYGTPEELLANPDIQVVIIAVNNNQHRKLVELAARAGKDIICEKPVAMSVKELDEMVKIVDECGVKFTVHQQRRYDPDYRTIKEIYDRKSLGDVYTIKNQLYGFNGNMHDWHVYVSEGGGMLFDWGVHLIDQVMWMMPEAKINSVFADVRNVINFEVDDYFNIMLKFDVDGFHPEGRIVRTEELLHNVSGNRTMTAAGPTRSFGNPREGLIVTEPLPTVNTSHRNYFENYVRAYHGQEEFLVKIPEVRRVLAVMKAIWESAKTGNAVAFEK